MKSIVNFERVGRLDFVYGARTLLADNWLYGQARGLMFVFFGKSLFWLNDSSTKRALPSNRIIDACFCPGRARHS